MSNVLSWWRSWRPSFAQVVAVTLLALAVSIGLDASAQDFSAITTALSDANTEVRTGVFPAVAAILGAVVLIGVAAGVVHVITRNR